MEGKKRKVDRIEKALVQAYRAQTVPGLPPGWRDDVMRHVRRLGAEAQEKAAKPATTPALQKILFPAAAAGGLVAAALFVYMLTALPGMEQDLFALLRQDPSGLLVTAALGL